MNDKVLDTTKITDTNLEEFKKLVRKAIFLEHNEEVYFNAIPNDTWRAIFAKNFNGNFNYAQRVVLNQFREIEKIDTARVDREKLKIHNLDRATKFITDAIDDKSPIIFITDFDNDGSLAQSVINEYLKIDESAATNIHVEYSQSVNGNSNRGFTVDLVDKILTFKGINPEKKFVIVTADNGINSLEEQKKVQAQFPNCEIVITDHHNPDPEMVIEENDKTVIFNPHYKPTEFYSKFNISGATTVGVLLKNVLNKRYSSEQLEPFKNQLDTMNKLFKVANLLDYVETDPADKPEKDYVISRFLRLQPLLNINNSISKIITGEITPEAIQAIKAKIPSLDTNLLYEEAKNIHIQNQVAKTLLKIFKEYRALDATESEKLKVENFQNIFIAELNKAENYSDYEALNPNFIEQLRPVIFGLTADDQNTPFLDALNEAMVQVFENIKVSEKKMSEALREGEVITKKRLENSVIAYSDPHILSIFNRKFLNKVYNDENPGFSLTLDSIKAEKVSGSFRSLYNISDILANKSKLEKALKVKIETPGHEKAAGFIIKSLNPEKYPVTESTIEAVNVFINDSIATLKAKEVKAQKTYLLTDLDAIQLINRINVAVRGNISNFEHITPLLKLTPDTIWIDSYTTEQFTIEDICKTRKYGYITVNINFDKDTVIVPVELVRRIYESNFKDYLSLGYMDNGVFMADRVLPEKDVTAVVDLSNKSAKIEEIIKAFEKDFTDKSYVNLTREQIKDNPFFKYSDYGNLNFDLFERMVIGILDTNKVDTLAVFDVEANGFGNAKLMNFGAMNYTINPNSGSTLAYEDFSSRFFSTERGEEYLLTAEEVSQLKAITVKEKGELPLNIRKLLLVKNQEMDTSDDLVYYLSPEAEKALTNKKIKSLPFLPVKNYIINDETQEVTFNREIQATMLAYLINDDDFRVPNVMTNLTGITQDMLRRFGKKTSVVDKEVSEFYADKKVLFGAHNTPYDARVLRANAKSIYETLRNNLVYDSALFSRKEKLAYDNIKVAYFENVEGLSTRKEAIYFYNNMHSEHNIVNFIKKNENGYYPDRSGRYLLEIENGYYYLVDKEEHKKVKLQFNKDAFDPQDQEFFDEYNGMYAEFGDGDSSDLVAPTENTTSTENAEEIPLHARTLLNCMQISSIPNKAIKYSVEELSKQWMIHSLLLSDEQFDIKHVDLSQEKYKGLREHEEALVFLQDNYHFDSSPEHNLFNFNHYYENDIDEEFAENDNRIVKTGYDKETMTAFIEEFLSLNKEIQQKFSDAWMYKSVLSIKDPTRLEITNDLVDLVNYQTSIPKEKIRVIFDEAIKFKEKHGIEHILQHEGHINGPWEGDAKGDVAFEDKLTLSLLAQRQYDSYTHNIKEALYTFNKSVVDARFSFDKAEKLGEFLANDSYSYRQGLYYARDEHTHLISSIQNREDNLFNNAGSDVVIFKLGDSVLPQSSAVYAVTHDGISISREQIEEDSEKLSFIIVNEQLKNSFGKHKKMTKEQKEYAVNILQANKDLCMQYKKELSERYRYIQFSRKEYQLKEFLDAIKEALSTGDVEKLEKKKIDQIDKACFNIIHEIVVNYVDGVNRYDDHNINFMALTQIATRINEMKNDCPESPIELALQNPNMSFGHDKEDVTESNFLCDLSIDRREPLKLLLNAHESLRLFNNFVDQAMKNVLVEKEECNSSPKMKM